MFRPVSGPLLWVYIAGALAVSGVVFFALQLIPGRFRKPLVALITFVAGLFYATEFFLPVGADNANFLTPYLDPVAQMTQVLQAFALGLGVYSLAAVHLRAIARQRSGWGFSVVLFAALFAIGISGLLKEYRPNRYNEGVFNFLFEGGLQNLDAAMFSIIAFYIVSAAYRAFRVRSVEATILLASASIVMLGQVALGQALTNGIPDQGFAANLRVENVANWILTRVNSPALLAVEFGLGIGALATSLRLWLSLERGSYFDKEL
jgi:hypothetical protein